MKLLLDHVLHLLIKLSQREWKEFQAESGIPSFDNRKGRDFRVLFVFLLTIHLFLLPTTLLDYADRADFKVGGESANPDPSTCSLLSWSTLCLEMACSPHLLVTSQHLPISLL